MSLFPLIFELAERSMLRPLTRYPTIYYRYPRYQLESENSARIEKCGPEVDVNKDGFNVTMDVKDFSPNEISVKTVDNSILIEGKHESKEDEHGFISRQFTRRYNIPEGFNIGDVVSQLSSDGVLTVKAAPLMKAVENNTRTIQIQQTGITHSPNGNKTPSEAVSDTAQK